MANQGLKRLLRRGPEMEEAEFELLQSRVLSRLTKGAPVPAETPTETSAENPAETPAKDRAAPELPVLAIDAGPASYGEHPDARPGTNGQHPAPPHAMNGEHPDAGLETNVTDSRIRSVKVTTYDLPATAVGVMDEPALPDWDLAALPMIVDRSPRKAVRVTRVRAVTESAPATKRPVSKRRRSERAAVSEPTVEPIAEPPAELIAEPAAELVAEPPAELIAEPSADLFADMKAALRAELIAEPSDDLFDEPSAEPMIEPSPELIVEPSVELAAELAAEPTFEPTTEPSADLIVEFIGAYSAKPAPAPTAKAATASTPQAAPATPPAAPAIRPADRRRAVAAPIEAAASTSSRPATAAVPYCPYCALRLDSPPTTSRRCARCHERIIVKRVEGRVIYLTAASVAVFDAERRRMINAGRWNKERSRWLKAAATVDAPAQRVARLAAAPISAGIVAASEALYTTTVERAFRSARRDRRWEDASRIRREQAQVLYRFAGSPIPPPDEVVRLHREGATSQLHGIEEMTRQAELVSAGCCDACRADGGHTFKISLELRSPRLPHAGCPRGLCRCDWYLPVRDQTMVRRHLRRRARADQTAPSRSD